MVSVSIEKDDDDEEVFLNFLCDVVLEGTKLKGEKLYSSNLTVLILLACRVFVLEV